ncbi:HECT-domain-containing protein [Rutstroemia sp. NJR-2017a BBW]|nr:HECT-domain-containing protein [Rutstroemia sp. NJR-2017a BBW]
MSGVSSRLRDILNNLKQKDDPSVQLIALQELSEILLVSTEDNLSGHFSPDAFVKELVALMQPSDFETENPEMMLLACRCLANLMEALPASTANVVYGGAVPVLCQKLLEIHFIDLAEQALSTLEKISVEYPASIVREGGLTACLTYLEFFATSTQRTAVTTAANCCRNIPEDSFSVVKDVMPILLNVLGSSDQKVVEQGSLCVTRVVESFRYHPNKLEELVSTDLLRAILRLLLPGTTNLIGPSIHTQFLRVLAFTAKASPNLSAELFKMNVVETLYQILTGVSPPSATDDVASKLDSVVIMQALIHRTREQVIETLNVICELLPGLPREYDSNLDDSFEGDVPSAPGSSSSTSRKKSANEKRIELLEGCKDEVRRFAIILFPTLTDAFSSTINLSVRQKVLSAQLKMLSNLDKDILMEALRAVPYASFLAAILSQQDHPSLVNYALQAAELLLVRLDDIYRYQFYREGVIAEIAKLAAVEQPKVESKPASTEAIQTDPPASANIETERKISEKEGQNTGDGDDEDHTSSDDDNEDNEDENENEPRHDHDDIPEDVTASPVSSRGSTMSLDGPPRHAPSELSSMMNIITLRAKKFLDVHENEKNSKSMKKKATKILASLQSLASDIENFYLRQGPGNGVELFNTLASYFDGDVLESVTSAELLNSEVVRVLLEVFNNPDEPLANDARSAFLEVFMGRTVAKKPKTTTADSPATPFSLLIHKLQDLLSRSEHFEVVTVHQNTFDGNRSSAASMLAKQIRLKLVADDDSDIPRSFRNIMVSIHAIATFKALDDYLRPRISMSDRSDRRPARARDGLSGALAALAAAGLPNPYAGVPNAQARLAAAAAASQNTPATSTSRTPRKSKSKTDPAATPASADQSMTNTPQEKAPARRSSRRQQAQTEPPPPPPPMQEEDSLANALECADERQLSEDDDMEDSAALDAIVGDLEEDMDEDSPSDPTAVNLEVAVGGKVTARKEDGTRVATPSQTAPNPSRSTSALQNAMAAQAALSTPPTSSRPMSYAAAVQAVPQDWHIEFSLDDKVIANETTIYRAVHGTSNPVEDSSSRSVWSAIHPIKFKRVPGPPPPEPSSLSQAAEVSTETTASGIPASLDKHPATSSILRLLNILHALNANLDDVLAENKDTLKLNAEPLSQFVNTKLTAKLNRQLEEPLIVASNCLPSWSEDLARLYPFLFPFETRHLFLQSTSFGYARSMTRWQNAQSADESRRDRHRDERPFLGRLQRQKVRISRSKILESALKVMELYGASQSILEVEYFEEVGTGLGPTLEFYSTVSKEFSKKKLKLWRETDANDADEYAFGTRGLFPAPMSEEQASNENGKRILHLFKMLGKFVARSMIDSRIIDVSFNPTFFRIGDESKPVTPSLGAVKTVDEQLAKSLKMIKKFAVAKKAIAENGALTPAQKVTATEALEIDGARIEDLSLDFTLPGYPIDLLPNGSQIAVTIDNVDLYLEKVIDMTLGSGVQRQVDAFRAGFTQVFPYSALSAFTPDELVMLFGRIEEDWSLETLMDSIKADHGFNMDSKSVKNLLQTMSELNLAERRDFLQFTTGSPKLPIGGFKSLTPMFTVVCKPSEPPYTSDDYLPSVMTCVNYLKLPDYSNLDAEYCPPLDTGTFLAIIADHDLADEAQVQNARMILDMIRQDAEIEEATGFDPSGSSGGNYANGDSENVEDKSSPAGRNDDANRSISARSQPGWSSVTDDASLSQGLSSLELEGSEFEEGEGNNGYTDSLEAMDDTSKEAFLLGTFPVLKPFDVKFSLKKAKGDINLAINDLLTQAFLEETGSRRRGIEAFSEDSSMPAKSRKHKGKKRNGRRTEDSLSSPTSDSPVSPVGPSKWETGRRDAEFICEKTGMPMQQVSSIYHKNGASVRTTILSILEIYPTIEDDSPENAQMEINTMELSQDFPSLPRTHVRALVQLTHPSTSNAHELAKALTSQSASKSTKPTIQIEFRPPPLNLDPSPSSPAKPFSINAIHPTHLPSPNPSSPYPDTNPAPHLLARNTYFTQASTLYKKSKSSPLMGGAAAYYSQLGRDADARAKAASEAAAERLRRAGSTWTGGAGRGKDCKGEGWGVVGGGGRGEEEDWWKEGGESV